MFSCYWLMVSKRSYQNQYLSPGVATQVGESRKEIWEKTEILNSLRKIKKKIYSKKNNVYLISFNKILRTRFICSINIKMAISHANNVLQLCEKSHWMYSFSVHHFFKPVGIWFVAHAEKSAPQPPNISMAFRSNMFPVLHIFTCNIT